ncbi:MAG TPA: DUF1080 domain-containing protein [Bryobacteraceae bacterium]|nr:DUF1080 domain-containing protein [Bryobacteraceae bacterium]
MRLLSVLVLFCSLLSAQTALTPSEISAGWILLFDGQTLFGWTPVGDAKWHAAGGVLVPEGESGWLRANTPFADFVLSCEFRTAADGNSGVFIRSAKEGAPHETGYEVQIWQQHPKFTTGSLVNHIAAKKAELKADAWNTMVIRAEGERFVVQVNGQKVLDGRDAKSRIGHIGLQYNKDKKIEFRNIKLRPLGLAPIFNGKDLSGWRVVQPPQPPKEPAEWTVKDGAIHVEKGGGQLETEGMYDDFVMQMDIRTNPKDAEHHPNSGVFFRGDANGYWTGYESQIRNEYKGGDRTQPVDFGTGAIYNRVAARKVVANDGEYFTKTIVARGRQMGVWVNGYAVTSWEDDRPEGMNARQAARLTAGTISLQAHDPTTNLDFRNIRLVRLPR